MHGLFGIADQRQPPGMSLTGQLAQKLPQDQCSFIIHPAQLDATLHLGASAGSLTSTGLGTGSRPPAPPTAKVPTAIGCFAPVLAHPQPPTRWVPTEWALLGDAHESESGTAAFSDYRLGPAAGAAFGTALLGLEARPAQIRPQMAATAAGGTAAESAKMLYSIELQAGVPKPLSGAVDRASGAQQGMRMHLKSADGIQVKVSNHESTHDLQSGLRAILAWANM